MDTHWLAVAYIYGYTYVYITNSHTHTHIYYFLIYLTDVSNLDVERGIECHKWWHIVCCVKYNHV